MFGWIPRDFSSPDPLLPLLCASLPTGTDLRDVTRTSPAGFGLRQAAGGSASISPADITSCCGCVGAAKLMFLSVCEGSRLRSRRPQMARRMS
jgi:hypothetical protein